MAMTGYKWKATDLTTGKAFVGVVTIGRHFGYTPQHTAKLCKRNVTEINDIPVRIEKISARRKVQCVELNRIFESQEAARVAMGLCSSSSIYAAIRHGHRARGYHWRYVYD